MREVTRKSHACLLLRFKGMAGEVCIPDEPTLLAGIAQLISSWEYTCTPTHDGTRNLPNNCIARVRRNARNPLTFDIESVYLEETLYGLPMASTLCALLADVLEAYIEESNNPITFHGGAFAMNGRLIAVTGPRRAGKSTLLARLCAERDLQIFCDDVLPISPQGEGVALGLAPRLRLPLPAQANKHFKQFVDQHLGPHDNRYGYLCTSNLARHGSRLPLGAIVMLDRQANTAARLHTMNEDDALFYALEQNMGSFESPSQALAKTQALLGKITCVRLVYSNLEEAIQLLRQAFDCQTGIHPSVPVGNSSAWTPSMITPPLQKIDSGQTYSRTTGATLRLVGNSAFLWQSSEQLVWRLNTVALAVWNVLEIPSNAKEITAVLEEVFQSVSRSQLEHDVVTMLSMMREEGFLNACPEPGSTR